ncbi:MAG TPA: RNA 2',3'-cyclic phosphodiesterase [Vicinamibacterales bacterium]|jgi:2'-5' RNA ligase|nr:RNA 2',3'-cyclic phosphodiesterase [Vicinamibacterales bacterium]
MRLFVAIEIEDEAKRAIVKEQQRLAQAISSSGLRWTKPDQMHLTLVFLGEIPEQQLESIVGALKRVEDDRPTPPFDVTFGGAGLFPPRGAPRVLWLGVLESVQTVSALQELVARRLIEIREAPPGSGPPAAVIKDRPFHPHVTLARWSKSHPRSMPDRRRATEVIRASAGAGSNDVPTIARTRVDSITLFRSTSSPPAGAGPMYTPLERVRLN